MDQGGETYTNKNFYCNKLFEFDTKELLWKEMVAAHENDNETNYIPTGRRSHSASMPH